MSYDTARSALGEAGIYEGSPLMLWMTAVHNRGNATSLMPSVSPLRGQLAEKILATKVPAGKIYPAPALLYNGFWYVPAPAINQQVYAAESQANKDAISRDQFWDKVQPGAILDTALTDAGKVARAGVSAITGIPSWAIPILLIGGAAFVLFSATNSLLPDRRK